MKWVCRLPQGFRCCKNINIWDIWNLFFCVLSIKGRSVWKVQYLKLFCFLLCQGFLMQLHILFGVLFILEKWCHIQCSVHSKLLWLANWLNVSTVPYYSTSFVLHTCAPKDLLVNNNMPKSRLSLYQGALCLWRFLLWSQISAGAPTFNSLTQ